MIADILAENGIPAVISVACWFSVISMALVWITRVTEPD